MKHENTHGSLELASLVGVIGGILAWGVIGLFIGPTLLAVTFSLLRTWVTA